jgi:hypothetical protein
VTLVFVKNGVGIEMVCHFLKTILGLKNLEENSKGRVLGRT